MMMDNVTLAIQLFTPKEVAKILAVDVETVRRYVRQGKIEYIKLSGKWIRIKYSDLEKFIKNQNQS